MFYCMTCPASPFESTYKLNQHKVEAHGETSLRFTFTTTDAPKRIRYKKSPCPICGKPISTNYTWLHQQSRFCRAAAAAHVGY